MRRSSLVLSAFSFAALACDRAPTAHEARGAPDGGEVALAATTAGSSVTGGGTITFGQSVEHVSVNVVGNSGRAVFHDKTATANVTGQIEITCVNIVGNVATLGGIVTRSHGEDPEAGSLEGFEALFQIVDNGEGSKGPDFMSPVLFHAPGTTEATCRVPGEMDLAPVKGNFKVEQ